MKKLEVGVTDEDLDAPIGLHTGMKLVDLDAPWLGRKDARRGIQLTWTFDRPTRVFGFELEKASGLVVKLSVGFRQQLAVTHCDLSMLTHHLVLPVVNVGEPLVLVVERLRGRVRPHGKQVVR